MAVVNKQVVFKDAIKNCKDLADHVVCAVQRTSYSYTGVYVVFDDYSVESYLKETTRTCHSGGKSAFVPHYQIEDHTCIKDFGNFLSSTQTKDRLTLYLAGTLINKPCLVTRLGVMPTQTEAPIADLKSSQEEADLYLYPSSTQVC